jgi:hypothetical protein
MTRQAKSVKVTGRKSQVREGRRSVATFTCDLRPSTGAGAGNGTASTEDSDRVCTG